MNNHKLQNDIDEAKAAYMQVSLSASEKVALKNLVMDAATADTTLSVVSPRATSSVWFRWQFYARAVPIALLMFVLVGTPVVFAAERSLPGDVLYNIKTSVNEEVREVFVPATEKDEYYQELLAKRASEMRILAKRGQLNTERAEIAHAVLADNVTEAIAASEASGEPEEEVLQDHQVIVAFVTMSEEIVDAVQATDDTSATAQPVEQVATATSDVEASVYKKFDAMREEASAALAEHVVALTQAEAVVVEEVVEELVDDARAKVAEVLNEVPRSDVVSPVLESVSVTVPVDVPASVLAPEFDAAVDTTVQKTSDAVTIDVETLLITGTEPVPSATVEQVLRVHERLAREKAERTVNALVEVFEGGDVDEPEKSAGGVPAE